METGTASCFAPLAADRLRRLPFARPTSPRKTRVRGFYGYSSGRFSSRRRRSRAIATGCGACGYKTASGRGKWVNRDPLGENGGLNLYAFVVNQPTLFMDRWGLAGGCGGDWGGFLYPPFQGPSLPSKGNCWRYACNNPMKPTEPQTPQNHYLNPPGWNNALQPSCASPCQALMNGINNAGGTPPVSGQCPSGTHMIEAQYCAHCGFNGGPDFHFSRQCPDGSWWDKPGNMEPRPAPGGGGPKTPAPGYQSCGTTCVPDGFSAHD